MGNKILYIDHAAGMGGSCVSLLYLIQHLDRTRYNPIVACVHDSPEVIDFYRSHGIETIHWPGISLFKHTTGGWYPLYKPISVARLMRQIWQLPGSVVQTRRLIEYVQPDFVHLNSLVLSPSALGVKQAQVPLIWHVRESVHPGHIGLRRYLLSYLFLRLADAGIFISESDRQKLTRGEKGSVIHNFVDFQLFDYTIDGVPIRTELGLSTKEKLVLFLGGQNVIKGVFPLLRAMLVVKQNVPDAHLLICNWQKRRPRGFVSTAVRSVLSMRGQSTAPQRIRQFMDRYQMHDFVHKLPWRHDVPNLLAASDVLVFPSIEPHFARPVIEAGAMGKPIVASRIGGVEELVTDGETGILVPPRDSEALAEAITGLLNDPARSTKMGIKGREQAYQRFSARANVEATTAIYDQLSWLNQEAVPP